MCGSLVGTPNYFAPELWNRVRGADLYKTDIYSLGVVFYVIANGKTPYPNVTGIEDLQLQVNTRDPTTRSNSVRSTAESLIPIPSHSGYPQLDSIIMSMLVKDPNSRASLQDIQSKLNAFMKEL